MLGHHYTLEELLSENLEPPLTGRAKIFPAQRLFRSPIRSLSGAARADFGPGSQPTLVLLSFSERQGLNPDELYLMHFAGSNYPFAGQ